MDIGSLTTPLTALCKTYYLNGSICKIQLGNIEYFGAGSKFVPSIQTGLVQHCYVAIEYPFLLRLTKQCKYKSGVTVNVSTNLSTITLFLITYSFPSH